MDDYLATLRSEFDAEDGSFLLKLRCFADWDRAAFSRLALAMQRCAQAQEGREAIERWIACGFWFAETYTASWVNHPDRRPTPEDDYYREACARLVDLSYWLFFGESPYEGEFPPPPG